MDVVILVPWRPTPDGHRTDVWGAVRPHLDALGYPIVTGDVPGPWSRGAAVNRAARDAGDWHIALIADADTIPTRSVIRTAVDRVAADGGALRPHDTLYQLNPVQTRMALRFGIHKVHIYPRQRTRPGGGLLVVSRDAWVAVNGYDETFIGWGHEDSDLNTRLLVHADFDRVPGVAYHLWHPEDRKHTPQRRANADRMHAVQHRHRRVIERATRERGYDVGAIL